MKKQKLNLGDIICIPLINGQLGFGQVVTPYNKTSGGFMIAIFEYKSSRDLDLNIFEILNSNILFLGFTFDSKIYHKHWTIVGNYVENINKIIFPFYKLGYPPNDLFITDYTGKVLNRITIKKFEKLEYKSEVAPVRYENALNAYWNLIDWKKEDYDMLLYSKSIDSFNVYNEIY